jgi:hypothetical protein
MSILKYSFVAITVFLTGCASVSETYTSDGKQGYSLNCSGTVRHWGMCYEKAGELCGAKGYEVLEKTGEQGAMASVDKSSGFATTTHSRNMIVKCKEQG